MEQYRAKDVDKWVDENGEYDAHCLFDEKLPKHTAKLNKLDKRIRDLLSEIQEVFPDAQYYTASGGFHLILGDTHEGRGEMPQNHRSAWGGSAAIGDGDW